MAHCLGGGSVISDRNYELFLQNISSKKHNKIQH